MLYYNNFLHERLKYVYSVDSTLFQASGIFSRSLFTVLLMGGIYFRDRLLPPIDFALVDFSIPTLPCSSYFRVGPDFCPMGIFETYSQQERILRSCKRCVVN